MSHELLQRSLPPAPLLASAFLVLQNHATAGSPLQYARDIQGEPVAEGAFRMPVMPIHSPSVTPLLYYSKDGQNVWRARNTTRNIDHLARDKEAPPLFPRAVFAQLFKVKELTDRATPACKEDFVHRPTYGRRVRIAIGRRYIVSPFRTAARVQNQG
jgi:hypothetical protein